MHVGDGIEDCLPFLGWHLGPAAQVLGRPGERFLPAQIGRLREDGVAQIVLQRRARTQSMSGTCGFQLRRSSS